MKKLIYLAIASIAIVSCKQEAKDYVTFSGKITNKNSDSIVVANRAGFKRVIKVDENGAFKDTMKVVNGVYSVFDGKEFATTFLRNGDDIKLTLDAKQFDETISYTGKGAGESNFIAKTALAQEEFFKDESLFKLPKAEFDAKIKSYIDGFNSRLVAKPLDSAFTANQTKNISGLKPYLDSRYAQEKYMAETLAKGLVSPKFTEYENHKGGKTSLDDLKGKYVYIDVWATWCNPCKQEIPYLKTVEKKFHDKNIEFVSVSIDQQKDHATWVKMVNDKELGGVQLFADNNWNSKFVKDYAISGIPRFILVDPEGNIVNANAPRPSSPELVKLFESLKM
ncbi:MULTISPECIES: TlpA family protein disulfide reductase [Tenacibaculum]|uniref:TlpA family protein disulfide reductase n=1 Tax=Tenacibaculum TaxID=104267 RepID=UPI000DE97414|nr:TlpA disulfide reductase family protein [Tenacibaculum sp. E3R01]RBW59139.1 thioredoxin [Tenacibaculum sp. E3R01]